MMSVKKKKAPQLESALTPPSLGGEVPVAKKVKPSPMITADTPAPTPFKGADLKALAILRGAKKGVTQAERAPEEETNAVDSDGTKFKVEKNENGKWENPSAARARYLERMNKRAK